MRNAAKLATSGLLAAAVVCLATAGCSGSRGPAGSPQWPSAEKVSTQALPSGTEWPGVYFINTAGSRGYMHLLSSGGENIHGCWLAEDKHARATFTGTVKDNLAMLDWTENKVGFAGKPSHLTAYLVLTPDAEGRDKVQGKYGEDVSNDGVFEWAGVRQKGQSPKEDGCKLDEGDTIETPGKGLQ
jgi:hypothetical protein